jgi:murein DD-endopeptidase MepM/ murein hydrolase activator NlpD
VPQRIPPHRARRSAPARFAWVAVFAALLAVLAPATTSGAESSVAEQLAAAYEEATAIAEELAALETSLAVLEEEIARHDAELATIRAELAELEDDVREIAVLRYVSAGTGPLVVAEDPLESQRVDVLMSAVQRDSRETMARFEDASARLDATTGALADRREAQEAARARLAERLADLDEELTRLEELERLAAAESARLEAERLQAARSSSTATTRPAAVASAAPAPTTTSPSTTSSTTTTSTTTTTTTTVPDDEGDDSSGGSSGGAPGGIVCPVQGAVVFVDSFRAPRSGGRQHMGVDMLAKTGTPAVAPVSGTVTHRFNATGGNSYHLEGDDGNYYYGTHLSAYGQSGRVSAGTVIGYVGDSGNAAGTPHLHFEIHLGGKGNAINPYSIVKAACS